MTPEFQNDDADGPHQWGLKPQLVSRFVVVYLAVTLLGSLLVLGAYRLLHAREQRVEADTVLTYVKKGYEQLAADWRRNGEETKAQIDFMRIFADSAPDPWVRLRAYFAAMEGKAGKFESGVILGRDDRVVLRFGRALDVLAATDGGRRLWYYSEAQHSVYEPVVTPLWLGAQGRGTMVLLQAVDTAHLRLLAPPGSTAYLVIYNTVITSSNGRIDAGLTIDANFSGPIPVDGRNVEQRVFDRFGAEPGAPRIVLRTEFNEPVSTAMVMILAASLLTLLSFMLWLVIGRWVQTLTHRVNRLSDATGQFSRDHRLSIKVEQALDNAVGPADEITDVAQTARDLMRNIVAFDEEHFAFVQTLDLLEEGVLEVARDGTFVRASPGWSKLAGRVHSPGAKIFDEIHPEDVSALMGQFSYIFSGTKTNATGRLRLNRTEATGDVWAEYRFVPGVVGPDGIVAVRGVLRDITQSYMLEKHISYMALHDALTGLPNRVLLEDRSKIAIRMADRSGHKVAIGFIDLDHFKDINDHFGHTLGDKVLVSLAESLRQCLRSGDTLARWGGDEFVVLLSDVSDMEGAREVAGKLITACEKPIWIDNTEFNVTFSMGVAVYPDDAKSTEALLSQADRAMFFAKDLGRNNVRFFADVLQKDENRRTLYIQNRLAAAIKNQQIQVWFQPVVTTDGRKVVGCEALARWHDDEYGWIAPATFIPMAENLGLIGELGSQVWHAALANLKHWREAGHDLHLAVNVSRWQLFTVGFSAELIADLENSGIPPACVELEITESVAMEDTQQTAKRLQELTAAGFSIAIDDFGTGYSSLSQLHNMPANKLKIDISFVRRIHEVQGAQLIKAIVQMAKAFNLQTVAEGVEDEVTAESLQEMGVNLLQGYHFGKPMAAAEFAQHFLRDLRARA